MRLAVFLFLFLTNMVVSAQFAPPVGHAGTTAIHKDSSVFKSWATGCTVTRGLQKISDPSLGYVTVGDSSLALGPAGSNGVVSLGDGGFATLAFSSGIKDGPGWDFAVFENAFSDSFLELAFVEVSSDGQNFFRFPAVCNIQDTMQDSSYGKMDASLINNLAGKYRAQYGVPFDLQELSAEPGLNINSVTHMRVIDVVGNIKPQFARYDKNGHTINDPWPTPFPQGGFDLESVGVIHAVSTGIKENFANRFQIQVYPNPAGKNSRIQYYLPNDSKVQVNIYGLNGKEYFSLETGMQRSGWQQIQFPEEIPGNGIYFITIRTEDGIATKKIVLYE